MTRRVRVVQEWEFEAGRVLEHLDPTWCALEQYVLRVCVEGVPVPVVDVREIGPRVVSEATGVAFKTRPVMSGIPKTAGFVCDPVSLDVIVQQEVVGRIDHRVWNEEVPSVYPTTEHLCLWIMDQIEYLVHSMVGVRVAWVSLKDQRGREATVQGDVQYRA